ncbi:MAG: hypothetical protein MN733_11980, partial [Nitrososphaera sp.]|nr:hypothetical protein [Nitrososphaera sp.]
TKESNDLLRTEITARLRPMISLSGTNNKTIEKAGKNYLEITTMISNSGPVLTRNLSVNTGVVEGMLIEHFVQSENDLKERREILSTFLPNASTSDLFFHYDFEEIENGKDTIVFWFHYKYLDFEEEAIQTLHYNHETKVAEVLGYYSLHDISDARKVIEAESKQKPHKYLYPPS